jgi:sulfite reductase alpha subunit-like flavoprotein
MIGAGTGVAPFRGFLQHRQHLLYEKKKAESVDLSDIGLTWLIFGCRDRNLDFIYQDEIKNFNQNNILSKLDCAFSRENEEIKYVQDVIKANSKEVVKFLIDNCALLYVCGDELTMAKDVQESIVQALANEANLTEPEARKKIADMRLNDEYLQDLWG